MTDRKKLMDMICESVQTDRCVGNCNHPHCNTVQIVCDHLISKGVTIPVRCKDCKNRDPLTKDCRHPRAIGWDVIIPEDDDYCSYGERKDND